MNSWSGQPLLMMMCIMPLTSAASVPGLSCSHRCGVLGQLGAPRVDDDELGPAQSGPLHLAADDRVRLGGVGPDDEQDVVAHDSSMELVIAPEPSVVARPATVGACQVRAQWSMLLVLMPARVRRCSR